MGGSLYFRVNSQPDFETKLIPFFRTQGGGTTEGTRGAVGQTCGQVVTGLNAQVPHPHTAVAGGRRVTSADLIARYGHGRRGQRTR